MNKKNRRNKRIKRKKVNKTKTNKKKQFGGAGLFFTKKCVKKNIQKNYKIVFVKYQKGGSNVEKK